MHQKPPNLPGTPESFFETVKNYKTQRKNLEDITQNKAFLDPELTCKQWALEETAFHRPWNQLSGGEQQRAFLAISLAYALFLNLCVFDSVQKIGIFVEILCGNSVQNFFCGI